MVIVVTVSVTASQTGITICSLADCLFCTLSSLQLEENTILIAESANREGTELHISFCFVSHGNHLHVLKLTLTC